MSSFKFWSTFLLSSSLSTVDTDSLGGIERCTGFLHPTKSKRHHLECPDLSVSQSIQGYFLGHILATEYFQGYT